MTHSGKIKITLHNVYSKLPCVISIKSYNAKDLCDKIIKNPFPFIETYGYSCERHNIESIKYIDKYSNKNKTCDPLLTDKLCKDNL